MPVDSVVAGLVYCRVLLTRTFTPEQYARATESWGWLDLAGKEPIFTSPFGDVFFRANDGFWWLDTLDGTLTRRWRTADELNSALRGRRSRASRSATTAGSGSRPEQRDRLPPAAGDFPGTRKARRSANCRAGGLRVVNGGQAAAFRWVRILASARVSRRETCIWEMPTWSAICDWVKLP